MIINKIKIKAYRERLQMTEDVRLEGYPKNRCRIKMHVLIEYSHNHQDRLSMTRNKLG